MAQLSITFIKIKRAFRISIHIGWERVAFPMIETHLWLHLKYDRQEGVSPYEVLEKLGTAVLTPLGVKCDERLSFLLDG